MASYSTGTVSVTNGSAVVTGSGTLFLANVAAGNAFTVVSSGIVYDVASVDSNTQVTLSAPYQGATDSGLSYTIHTAFTSPDQFPLLKQGDIETATIISRAINKIQQRFNLVGDAAAISSAGLYSSIAAGLADTVDTEYFFVISGSEFILYLNNAGSEVEQLRFASLSVVQQLATDLSTAVDSAETFADNADTSATNAATSETNASTSETNAADSESNAATSASNAATSASAASTSATNAATSEANALEYATQANYSADIAMSNAHFKGRWADLTGSLVVPASVSHGGTFYQLLETIPDVTADEPPSANWQEIPVNDAYIVFDGNGNATFTGNIDAPIGDFEELVVATTDVTQVLVDIEGIAANYVPKRSATGYDQSSLSFSGADAGFNGSVSVGASSPKSQLEVVVNGGNAGTPTTGTVGRFTATASVGNAAYIEVIGGTSGSANIALGDSDNGDQGTLSYSNTSDTLGFGANGNYNQLTINSSGNVTCTGTFTARGTISAIPVTTNTDAQVVVTPTGTGDSYFTWGGDFLRFSNTILFHSSGGVSIGSVSDPGAGSLSTTGDIVVTGKVGGGGASTYQLDVMQAGAPTTASSFEMARIAGAHAVANDLTLLGPNTSQVRVRFGDGDAPASGEVGYDHATDIMQLVTAGSQRVAIDSTGVAVTGKTVTDTLNVGTATGATYPFFSYANDATNPAAVFRQDGSAPIASFTGSGGGVIATIGTTTLAMNGAITATTGVTPATSQDALTNLVEDTYTATLTPGGGGTVTLNSSFDTLSYTRINGRCFVSGYIEVSSVSSPLGGLTLNLPFVSAALPELAERSAVSVVASGLSTKNCNEMALVIEGGSSSAAFYLTDGTSFNGTSAPEIQASTVIIFDFSYPV